jgi:hypothetical protein
MTISSWGELANDQRALRSLMRSAGGDIKTKTTRLIAASGGSGRRYGGGGGSQYRGAYSAVAYTASAAGEPPVRVTGTLRQSLKTFAYKSGEGFAVRARAFYSLFLEAGASGGGNPFGGRPAVAGRWRGQNRKRHARGRYKARTLAPRPFLDRVMAQEQAGLERRVRLALDQGLTWKQTK